MNKKGPDFLAIGPTKTGTAWLYQVLRRHPALKMPSLKEINFFYYWEQGERNRFWIQKLFSKDPVHSHYQRALRDKIGDNFGKLIKGQPDWGELRWLLRYFFSGWNHRWYAKLFDQHALSGDISPMYSLLQPASIAGIRAQYPDVKIIIGLRDPIDRIWSHAKMMMMKGNGLSGDEMLESTQFSKTVSSSRQFMANDYVALVKNWREHFPEEQIFIYYYEELEADSRRLFERICTFLGLEYIPNDYVSQRINPGLAFQMPPVVRDFLFDLNKENLRQMTEYFDSPFPHLWWEKYSSYE